MEPSDDRRVDTNRRLTYVTYVIYVVGFLDLFGVSMIIPILLKHAKELGASPAVAGLLGSVYGGLQLFSSPLVGKWSDMSGRQFTLMWCLLFTAVGYSMLGVSSSITLLLLARIPTGIFKHSQGIAKTYLADMTPADQHAHVFGQFNGASSIGFIVGPVVGGHLTEYLPGGFHSVCVTAGIIFFLNSALVWWFIPEGDTKRKTDEANSLNRDKSSASLKKLASEEISFHPLLFIQSFKNIDWTNMWDIFLVRFLMGFAVLVYRTNFVMVLDYKFQTSPKENGYIISYSAVVATVSGFLTGRVAKWYRGSDMRLLTHMGIVQFIMILALTFAPNIPLLMLFNTPLSMANSIIRVATTKMTIQRTTREETGALLGLGNSIMSIARMLSPTLGGLAAQFSMSGPGVIGAFSALAAVIVINLTYRQSPHKKQD